MSRRKYTDTNISLGNIDPTLKRFLDGQTSSTRRTYGCLMRKWIEYINLTGKQTGKQLLAKRTTWEQEIMIYLEWLKSQGYSDSYATTACGMVRSFFDFNRKPLKLNRQERTKLKARIRNSEDYLFSKEDLSKMATVGSLKEKYIVFVGASFGLRSEDFSEITYGKLRMALEQAEKQKTETPIPLDPIFTLKEKGVKAHPFVNSDALPIIQQFLENGKDKPDSERVWNERPSQLTVVLQTLAKKSGINSHDSRIRFHNLRKYLCDRLSSTMSESKWKQIVGKKISEGAYISTDELREGYLRAMPSIVVNTNGNGLRKEVTEAKEELGHLKTKNIMLFAILEYWANKSGDQEMIRQIEEIKKQDAR